MINNGFGRPAIGRLSGSRVHIEKLDWSRHRQGLFDALGGDENAALLEFLPFERFDSPAALQHQFESVIATGAWQTNVVVDQLTERVVGSASLMRVRPEHGSCEVGCIVYSQLLRKTAAATEAMYLLMKYVFDELGYRRYEWKCDDRNAASIRAAERLGFSYEGTFRQDRISKGRNRNTAWFSILDEEWSAIRSRLESWLAPGNFDETGQQIQPLSNF